MDKKTNSDRKEKFILISGLFSISILLILMLVFYITQSTAILSAGIERSISETAQLVATTIRNRTDSILHNLELATVACSKMETTDDMLAYLNQTNENGMLRRLSYTGLDGVCHTTDGVQLDVRNYSFYQDIVTGGAKGNIDFVAGNDLEAPSFICSVPLYRDGTLAGILSASNDIDNIRNALSVDYWDGEAFFHIVRKNGDVILFSDNKNANRKSDNLFELFQIEGTVQSGGDTLEQLKTNMEAHQKGMLYFDSGNKQTKIMCYLPLEISDWYILSIVPTSYIQHDSAVLTVTAVVISILIMLLFLLLICLILWNNRKHRQALEKIAFIDPVTGGYNRTKFEMEMLRLIRKAPAGTYALLSIDVYQFKTLNDVAGGREGDEVLRYCYHTLTKHFPGLPVGRISSDMFDVLFLAGNKEDYESKLKQLAKAINEFNRDRENKYYLRLAAGIYPIDNPNLDIITIQDRANIARKSLKKNAHSAQQLYTLSVYNDDERQRQSREREMMDQLDDALKRQEIQVYLQPKIDLETNRVCAAEALCRWQDPQHGMIPPDEFIPLFERDGSIVKVDLYMFDHVCRLIRSWIDRGWTPLPISVNLSRVHLYNPDFLERFIQINKQHQVPAGLIEFEITESVAFENMEQLSTIIQQMHHAGFRCSLDDFGSGYSSLNLLNEIPVDIIKLDRDFFRITAEDNNRSRAIIESVVTLAKKLHAKTVSEGVETEAQVQFLRHIRCDMVQGFVFSRPLSVPDFETFVKEKNA